jgi:hypothetical protein
VGLNFDNRVNQPDSFVAGNLAIGQTITGAESTPLGDFTYCLSVNVRQDFSSPEEHTFCSLSPGTRTRLWGTMFFLAA